MYVIKLMDPIFALISSVAFWTQMQIFPSEQYFIFNQKVTQNNYFASYKL
jgi:hypothetical protein